METMQNHSSPDAKHQRDYTQILIEPFGMTNCLIVTGKRNNESLDPDGGAAVNKSEEAMWRDNKTQHRS